MVSVLVSERFQERFGEELDRAARVASVKLERIVLPADPAARLEGADLDRVRVAYFSGDLYPTGSPAFFAAVLGAPSIEWIHLFNVGTDHPIFDRLLERGVRLSNSAGSSAEPIAQSVLASILAFSRGIPAWMEAKTRRSWEPRSRGEAPPDLRGQTLVVVGLGAIGLEVARLARAFGLRIVGVRRSPSRSGEPVDELLPPSRLRDALARADWLVLSCPLTDETRGMIDKAALDALPRGAHVINVGRGPVIVEPDLVDALRARHIAGAYLDVFDTEPLPESSPLWELPNVILSPHDSAPARGNERRQAEGFGRNLARFLRGEPLENELVRERITGRSPGA